ncbi:MAG TPA: hypothetical protein VMH86_04710 [Rhizomicrobium sp.]|nr:hypothetical protein [Rhizomicrobium sp.]
MRKTDRTCRRMPLTRMPIDPAVQERIESLGEHEKSFFWETVLIAESSLPKFLVQGNLSPLIVSENQELGLSCALSVSFDPAKEIFFVAAFAMRELNESAGFIETFMNRPARTDIVQMPLRELLIDAAAWTRLKGLNEREKKFFWDAFSIGEKRLPEYYAKGLLNAVVVAEDEALGLICALQICFDPIGEQFFVIAFAMQCLIPGFSGIEEFLEGIRRGPHAAEEDPAARPVAIWYDAWLADAAMPPEERASRYNAFMLQLSGTLMPALRPVREGSCDSRPRRLAPASADCRWIIQATQPVLSGAQKDGWTKDFTAALALDAPSFGTRRGTDDDPGRHVSTAFDNCGGMPSVVKWNPSGERSGIQAVRSTLFGSSAVRHELTAAMHGACRGMPPFAAKSAKPAGKRFKIDAHIGKIPGGILMRYMKGCPVDYGGGGRTQVLSAKSLIRQWPGRRFQVAVRG